MNINLTHEASSIEAGAELTKRIETLLRDADPRSMSVEFVEPVTVTEGAERCGSGKLHVSGLVRTSVRTMPGEHVASYRIDSTGSIWRNYGAPSGTRYEIKLSLAKV